MNHLLNYNVKLSVFIVDIKLISNFRLIIRLICNLYFLICAGCDEVKFLPSPEDETYLNHVSKVANYIHRKRPHLAVLIWDDVLRNFDVSVMKKSQIQHLIQPMVK